MATMKDLALKIHQRTSRYTNLNQQIQDNAGNINANLSKISTIESQVQELQDKANALRGYKEYNAHEAYSVGDIIEAEGLFKVIKAITAEEEHPELSDQEYFVNLTYTLDDLDALISRLDAELGSLAEIAGQIEFDTIELGGNSYPLVMKKPIPPAPFDISTDTITLKQGESSEIQFTNDGCTLAVTTDYNLVNVVQNSNSLGLTAVTDDMGSDRLRIVATKEGFTPKTVEITVIVPDVTIECDPLAISIDGEVDEYKDVVVTTNGDDISFSVNNDNCSVELLSTSEDGLTKIFRVTGESDGGSVITFNALVDGNVVETCTCGVTLSNMYTPQIAFTASADGSAVNFFKNTSGFNTSDYDVYINGVKTSQAFNSLTFNANDKIQIKANKEVTYFPHFSAHPVDYTQSMDYIPSMDYIQSIDYAFPLMSIDNSTEVTNFNSCFEGCSSLTSIPNDLFKYNPNVTNFGFCFYVCKSLTSIPEDLFKYNTKATEFDYCFFQCAALTSIPQDLFKYNTNVTSFVACFRLCGRITSAVPELWVSHPNASGASCFYSCDEASNYADIPIGWKSSHII